MTAAAPTRRAMLGLFAAAPIAAGITSSAYAYATTTTFAAKLAEFRRLDAIYETIVQEAGVAQSAVYASRPPRPKYDFRRGDTLEVASARFKAMQADYEAAEQALERAHRLDWHEKRRSEASSAVWNALNDVLEMPAPTVGAVATKLDLAMEQGMQLDDLGPLLDDLRRLGGH